MNFRFLLLFALGLSACNDPGSSSQQTSEGTFVPPVAVVDTGGTKIIEPEPTAQQIARMKAANLQAQGKIKEAALVLKEAGLISEAAGVFKSAGLDEEAYQLYAPEDFKLEDTTKYDDSPDAQLAAAVDEKPSVMRHKMTLNGKTFWYTASAGHLTAFAKNPEKQEPQASVFYTAYTRDDLPRESRPVTFFFNGGPGASSIYLHLASYAPQRAFLNGPEVKPEWKDNPPDSFPMIDDKESLIDKSDLVFVDITPGTGYSQAIAPKKNQDFWGVTVDVELSRQFITRYVNFNHRQVSPKYLYGESYAGGIRVPKLARALLEAGKGDYEKSDSVSKATVLTGVVFHSPAFDYAAEDAVLPTTAMTADYLKKTTARGDLSLDEYAQVLRDSMMKQHSDGIDLSKYLGPDPLIEDAIHNAYDYRMYLKVNWVSASFWGAPVKLPTEPWYKFDFFEERALNNIITAYLPAHVNYKSASAYTSASWSDWFHSASGAFESWDFDNSANGLPDIVEILKYDPSLKLLTVHGYYDTVTPFRRSELDLEGVVFDKDKNLTLLDRIPVKNFAGGHMIYYSEEARAPLKKTLDEFYDAPPHGNGPTIVKARDLVATIPAQRAAPVPAIALH
ncbi:S10 family serine carboxypeptidase-like protein [Candidatus Phyllobacterium onerii]|uniref:S10 family serine carboxypeptidase-like protein n=1 Tax=Candidatus Phyllobacterium onerii TaxID=3020828 RepID=UPI00232E44ED|nr:hypothetical protein [Phyllobacterium sp. IY22]